MMRCTIIATIAATASGAQISPGLVDISGKWAINIGTPAAPEFRTLDAVMSADGTLSGTLGSPTGAVPITTGRVTGTRFVLSATLELEEDDPERIMKKTKEIWMYKRNTQPLNTKNCGCIFKNPRGLSAGALIDQAGLKGFRVGGAEVSDKHANFVIAHPGCKADDVMKLVKIIREKVFDKNEIHLESEVQIWP